MIKGIDYFDYIVKNQLDPLIDNNKLADDFLDMYEKAGLLKDDATIDQDNLLNEEDFSHE